MPPKIEFRLSIIEPGVTFTADGDTFRFQKFLETLTGNIYHPDDIRNALLHSGQKPTQRQQREFIDANLPTS